ncbi:MAG TPA: NTP transferase domain-containing protein [Candidatus Limiplasma sp.]|nr:NTP transferase domain-containing protein [Candidatus Limiplasma sp.]
MAIKPILLIMAAGMGSRYGGLKQMDPVGPNGEFILDYSLFDARRAGFSRAVVVIKREMEQDFRRLLCDRVQFPLEFAYQELSDLPHGFTAPPERKKPWGTGHAVLAARRQIDAPFCVINADDYYGAKAFNLAYEHLAHVESDGDFSMVGYRLRNTLSETGFVARGVCEVTPDGTLVDIVERTHIISTVDGPLMSEDLRTYTRLDPDTIVSMNMWGFPRAMIDRLGEAFPAFLNKALRENPEKAEFFLPGAVDGLLRDDRARVTVTATDDRWYGVTYREDRQLVVDALRQMTDAGVYPKPLWAD